MGIVNPARPTTNQPRGTQESIEDNALGTLIAEFNGAITNANISASANIAKSKLANLQIVDADVSATAAIAQAKLALSITNAQVANGAAIAESKLSLATDAAAGTASRRTLGTGATQALPGNHSTTTNSRTVTTTVWATPTRTHAADLSPLGDSDTFQYRTIKGLFGDWVQLRGVVQLANTQVPSGANKDCCSGLPGPGARQRFTISGHQFPETLGMFYVEVNGQLVLERIRNVSTSPATDATSNTDAFVFTGLSYPI